MPFGPFAGSSNRLPLPGTKLRQHPLSHQLASCWLFNERAGIATDVANPRNKLTLTSGTPLRHDGATYNGSSDYSQVNPYTSPTDINNVTMVLRAKPTSVTADQYVVNGGVTGFPDNQRTILCGFQDGFWNLYNNGYPTGTASQTQVPATAGVEQQIAFTSNGSTLQGYRNGVQQYSVSAGLVPMSSLAIIAWSFAAASGGGAYFGGTLYQFLVYNRVLLPTEVAWLWAEPWAMCEGPTVQKWFTPSTAGGTIPRVLSQYRRRWA